MKKAIFGGTFDPIHIGHIHIAYEALYNLSLDEVIFMPNGRPPHKRARAVTEEKIRYKMVYQAIKGEKKFSISDFEIKSDSLSYTYNTLMQFNHREPYTQWYFLVGVDSLMTLRQWKNIHIILDNCTLVVFSRTGYAMDDVLKMKKDLEKEYGKEIILLEMSLLDISSTEIKKKISEDKMVNYLLPQGVEEVINQYNLYRNKV
ncbi:MULTISPECIES: nicotinate-nucleotide adenylyltransferase [unclassified Clostridium]|uniref:nicotinate-nucleotide adenylyltransferase n=1 Tax=unclassified Clostridium TaxID=2614128 RepID=UPI000E981356|nr:nicotinic acid mononucleotide adenylyltransferase [Clostridium sp.]